MTEPLIIALREVFTHAYRQHGAEFDGEVRVLRPKNMKVKEYQKLTNPLGHCAVIIGIDPGTNTGVAYGSREDPTIPIQFKTLDFWSAYDFVKRYDRDITGIVIEADYVKQFVYAGSRTDKTDQGRMRDKVAANIGSNRREGALLAERLEELGFPVVRVRPTKTKWTAEECKRHTGITARTNEHTRDAIRLVWERI